MIIKFNNILYRIIKIFHRTSGKGVSYIKTKLKNIKNNKNLDHRFYSYNKIDIVNIKLIKMQFLYKENNYYIFMNQSNFIQKYVPIKNIKNGKYYLQNGKKYNLEFVNNNIIGIKWSLNIIFKVIKSFPNIKNSTFNSFFKTVYLENKIKINVPVFIKVGDYISINTINNTYVNRIK